MKRIVILLFVSFVALSARSQTFLQAGDSCFNKGNYDCAITNYNEAFKMASGKDKQIAEIKLTRAKNCSDWLKAANQAYNNKNYTIAKEEYQKVLDSNPKDNYAKSQLEKCNTALNPPILRKATTAELTDIWNNKYGINPERRQKLIAEGIDPDDAQRRINNGEGKPQEKQATTLTVSTSYLYFSSNGGISEQIKVYSDASTYSVPSGYIPSWCTVKTYSGYFTVTVSANPDYTSRKNWFKVTAGGKEVRISVEQFARTSTASQQSSSQTTTNKSKAKKCFNCPKTHNTWGLTFGYIDYDAYGDGLQFGIKAEPLFKYGFGLNTGLNLEMSSYDLFNEYATYRLLALNIPLHLEYRLNFSKSFNIFAYSGIGFNALINSDFDHHSLPATFEYGGGFRISHVQFNVGRSLYLGDWRDIQDFRIYGDMYQKLIVSVSYMF